MAYSTESNQMDTIFVTQTALLDLTTFHFSSWLGGSVVERRSLTGELSQVCSRPAADE